MVLRNSLWKATPHFSTFSKNYENGQGNTEIRKWKFHYFKEEDIYVFPKTGVILPYRNIDKNGYKQYYDRKQCEGCPYQKQCCGKNKFRTIRRLLFEEVNERARERRLSPEGKKIFQKRKTTVERSFGDSKQNHGYRWIKYKGVEKNQAYTHLICVAQNMKNISIKQEKVNGIPLIPAASLDKTIKYIKNIINFNLKYCIRKLLEKNLGVCQHSGKH